MVKLETDKDGRSVDTARDTNHQQAQVRTWVDVHASAPARKYRWQIANGLQLSTYLTSVAMLVMSNTPEGNGSHRLLCLKIQRNTLRYEGLKA